jgi:hypothetical protein
MEGYHIQQLQQQQAELKQQRATLTFQAARMLSPESLNRMATRLKMVDPTPQQVQFLDGSTSREARNHLPLGSDPIEH